MRQSRISECFASNEEFLAAIRQSVRAFAYERAEAPDGSSVLIAPGHTEAFSMPAFKQSWRPFKAKHVALEGYEAPVTGLVSFLLRRFPISTFYDVGAAIGVFSFFAASTTGKTVTVHAFEMSPRPFGALERRIAASGETGRKIHAHLAGLSDRHEGAKQVWYSRTHMFEKKPDPSEYREAWHRRLKFALRGIKDRDELQEVSLLLTSVDAFARKHAPPQCIKIDVDGYEGKVLKGAEETLRAERPFVVLELHQDDHIARTGWSRDSVTGFLFDLGYKAIYLTNHHNVVEAELVEVERGSAPIKRQTTGMFLFY